MAAKKPSKGRNLSVTDKIELATLACDLYAQNKYTLRSCLRKAGIKSDATFYAWRDEIEEIKVIYQKAISKKEGKEKVRLVALARSTLEKALTGHVINLVDKQVERVVRKNDEGQEVADMVLMKEKRKQIYVRPNLKAAEIILYNFDGENFTQNPEPFKGGNISYPDKINVEIVNGSVDPVTSEDDIADPKI